ncbi:MAG: UDP-N-acetylmuramoyl-L-alanyl-D-glutamate--2,6-diaminopimelate ligase [Treponema sp.]|jgi:UDP-N-acetylmuramoyl-L-alanyl-D-glutamate--2,6-diaminopimelate ligase|nr:UDP-N-acetylmuramoyl-L-alanyl-D-glutamate--2,6-diaminopimelate ligase [Treponema sp.]
MSRPIERRLSAFFTGETAARAGLTERSGDADPLITALEYDSRKVKPGTLFCALPGLHTDGHTFIDDAINKGAATVVHEAEIGEKKSGIVYLKVQNSRFAMSPIAAAFYGFPSRRLVVAGVTGTEGKSTTVYLIWQLLRLMGKKAGFFSTVQHSDGGEAQWNPEHQTTPEATAVQRMLCEMADNGCAYAVVESSSHGLSPRTNRLGDVEFDAAVLTNVTHEHLEFHGSWEQYRNDKANLFRALDTRYAKTGINGAGLIPEPFGVINADDKSAAYFTGVTKRKTLSFSVNGKDADLMVKAIESGAFGNWYNIFINAENAAINIRDRLPGAFNAGNVLAALLTVSGLTGVPVRKIAPLCPRLLPVRGRMTAINKGQPFEVLVDYAHTPSSFQTIFPPLRKRQNLSGGRIISLFGSAGERDTQKRAEQGKIAAAYSDYIVLTDEDPRGEVPRDILDEIARGVYAENPALFKQDENLFLIPDRPAAIRKALSLARAGDIVLLLGKGHENTIIYKDYVMPFDEFAEAEKTLGE